MKVFIQNKYLLDFLASIMFFTRIPINWSYFSKEAPDLTRAAWSFPLVGFLIGFLSGIFGELFILINIPILLSCVIAISISVIITGAFHEDGFADMADGFGAGGYLRFSFATNTETIINGIQRIKNSLKKLK